MMEPPETRYVDSGGVKIAYQVVGEGPVDLVMVPGFVSNVDMQWTDPEVTRFNERLASFCRLVMYDKAGTGLSDPVPAVPTLEQRMQDLGAVLDAAGAARPVLFGVSEGGPMSLLFAATYPERVRALILFGSMVCGSMDAEDNPCGPRWLQFSRLQTAVEHWGRGLSVDVFSPTLSGQPMAHRVAGIHERAMASPAMARAAYEAILQIDVRDVLPAVQSSTLLIHRVGDTVPIEGARYMAEHIPDARLIELPGADHWWWVGESEPVLDAIEEFVTGSRPEPRSDRMLATVMFTDIVESTERVTAMGDAAWRELLERHNETTREQIASARGREIASTGDGFFATFDGPARGVRCARAIIDSLEDLGIEARAGLHAGECEAVGENVGGIAVHIGARVAAAAGSGEVLVSTTVRDLVAGSGIAFQDAGVHELKGLPEPWQLYRALDVAVQDAGTREPLAPGTTPLVHEEPPLSQRAMIAAARRAPRLSRRFGERLYQRGR
jgi:pimeloyl-ACP methyl ester carboxylesterase